MHRDAVCVRDCMQPGLCFPVADGDHVSHYPQLHITHANNSSNWQWMILGSINQEARPPLSRTGVKTAASKHLIFLGLHQGFGQDSASEHMQAGTPGSTDDPVGGPTLEDPSISILLK